MNVPAPHIWVPKFELPPRKIEGYSCMPSAVGMQRQPLKPVAAGPPTPPGTPIFYGHAGYQTYTDTAFTTPATADTDDVRGWKDLSGNNHHLTFANTTNKPALKLNQVGGKSAVRFNGSHTVGLTSGAFTFNQPSHMFMIINQVAWASKYLIDGVGGDTMDIFQTGTTPNICLFAGGFGPASTQLTVGSWMCVEALFSGTSSFLKVASNADVTTPTTTGTSAPGGVTVAHAGAGASTGAQADYALVLIYNATQDSTARTAIRSWITAEFGIP